MKKKMEDVFNYIAQTNMWGSKESVSGTGSEMGITELLRNGLPELLQKYNIRTMVDAACGDMNWMRHLNYEFEYFIGVDILPAVVEKLRAEAFPPQYHFQVGNVATDILPRADAVFCRDCLVHLTLETLQDVSRLWRKAGFKYALATTFPDTTENVDCEFGEWRPLNMELAPFHLGKALDIIDEKAGVPWPYHDKSVGIWEL